VSTTPEALLVLIARTRLANAGLAALNEVDPPQENVESLLYRELQQRDLSSAYGTNNGLKRTLDSFVRALLARQARGWIIRRPARAHS
tara:strand:+ start:3654 stop:3917 length:264 start_codon:yes stop_codon:yes gene_type:complete